MYIAKSPRLFYRKMTPSDFTELKSMLSNPQIMYAWEHTFSDEQIHGWIQNQENGYQKYGVGYFLAIDRVSRKVVGQIGLHHFELPEARGFEVCYMLKASRVAEQAGFIQQGVFIKHYHGKDMPHFLYIRHK